MEAIVVESVAKTGEDEGNVSIRLSQNVLRDFTCVICTQYFRVPVSLPCGTSSSLLF